MDKDTTKEVKYMVEVNGNVSETFDTLKEARDHVKKLNTAIFEDEVQVVEILRQVTTTKMIEVYKPKTITVLTADSLDMDISA